MQTSEHVSEEAAKMAKMTGGEGPDLDVGTPVQDILKEDKEALENAPQVLKDSLKSGTSPPKPSSTPSTQSRSYSTTRSLRALHSDAMTADDAADSPIFNSVNAETGEGQDLMSSEATIPGSSGHIFPLPELPLPRNTHLHYRYDPVVDQVTNLLMKDGKLSVAQRNMSIILTHLRTAPAPTYSGNKPLLPGAPPASHLPLNPILYLTLAIDSVAPLLRIRSQRGAAGGGAALQIPIPLSLRQRRRQAVQWILDAAEKRKSRGSGRGLFAQKVAEEIVSVVEGRSSIWERR
ncbi:hypothetical protein LTR66_005142 [Elasticomyces elasticus]|nr:hypothetical protein LTR66_005142 [Elasticomyces elasticus]